MKNFTNILLFILLLAVAVLFYLHFSNSNGKTKPLANNTKDSSSAVRIAYFEMDSIESKYDYLKDVRADLRSLEQSKGNELNSMRNDAKQRLQSFQSKGQSMTQEEIQKANEELMALDNKIKVEEQKKSQELQDESIKKLQEVKKVIEDYLKEFNANKKYTYILSSSNDIFYYKDTVYNVTNEMLKGLNEAYKKKKSK